jgi:peroxiredoxin/uncharacterized MAPEG superfamily protein
MHSWLNNPTFVVYALTCIVLSLNLLLLWAYSGAVRSKTGTAINKEDADRFGAKHELADPPEVARVLRAHTNAQAAIVPFLILGFVYVLAGGPPGFAKLVFGTFVAARLLHSLAYLAGRQPWRTVFFSVGAVATGALIVDLGLLIAKGPIAVAAPPPRTEAAAEVQVGKPAPEFTGTTYDGKTVTLSSLKGQPVVLYFYPKDETAGCTKEACSFRDSWDALSATHATLVGVSMDNTESHKEFIEHWKLPFVLLSDPDGAIANEYGVPVKNLGIATFESRQTFVIGSDGVVRKIYREVDVSKHAAQVLADLSDMK